MELMTTAEASEFLRVSSASLERWRTNGGGPPFIKVGHRVCYDRADLEAWLRAQRREHTGGDEAAFSRALENLRT